MANFTAITTGAAANAATINSPLGELDTAIGTLASLPTTVKTSLVAAVAELYAKTITGGASVTAAQLKEWTEAGAYEITAVTYSTTYLSVVATATVKWPDGSAGTLTATTINATYEAIDAYTISHTASGLTVTQAAVTRNADGNVITKPVLTAA